MIRRPFFPTLVFIFLLLSGYGQTTIGRGLVTIDYTDTAVVHFYKSPKESLPAKTVHFKYDSVSRGVMSHDLDDDWLIEDEAWPWQNDEERSIIVLQYKAQKGAWLQIIVNNENKKTYWLKQSKEVTYITWKDYFRRMFAVNRLATYPQAIRTAPRNRATEIKYTAFECFHITEMKGDWVKIENTVNCDDDEHKAQPVSGWIKWRHHGKVVIEYFLTS